MHYWRRASTAICTCVTCRHPDTRSLSPILTAQGSGLLRTLKACREERRQNLLQGHVLRPPLEGPAGEPADGARRPMAQMRCHAGTLARESWTSVENNIRYSARARFTIGGMSTRRRCRRLWAWYRLVQGQPHEYAGEPTGDRVCVGGLGEAGSLEECACAHVGHREVDLLSFVVHRITLDRPRTL